MAPAQSPSYAILSLQSLGTGRLDKGGDKVLSFKEAATSNYVLVKKSEAVYSLLKQSEAKDAWRSESKANAGEVQKDEPWSDECVARTAALWELSDVEYSKLVDLGRRLQDLDYHKNIPAEVVRFMKARPSGADAAEAMFRQMVAWRIKNRVDSILQDYHPPRELLEYHPGAILQGLDKEGDPVFLSRTGVTDSAGMLHRFGKHEMIQHAIWLREMICTGVWIQKYEQEHRRPVKRIVIIEDVHGLPLLQSASNRPLLSMYGEVINLDQCNYPETAKHLIIIRAPALFRVIWNIVQHFFDPGVRQKMVFCGSNNYTQVLSKYLDPSILPDCVVPGRGKGKAVDGMPSNFEGGLLPVTF